MQDTIKDTEQYRDKIATVDEKGKRIWIFPKKPFGRFYNWRKLVSYALLIVLFGAPFIKVYGEPLLLFNVLERRFIIFGIQYMPQDFHLFVLAMLTLMVFIILFTVVFGRLFCGWVCPQTIFMEMVFRRIEYWIEGDANAQRRLNKAPWTADKLLKKGGKQAIFFGISVLIANTFLSYIIGYEEVFRIATEPIAEHWQGFIAMIIFSALFFFVFSSLREQVCVTICPYGRLQGVLLDQNSIVVHYDFVRGEPRGKKKRPRKEDPISSIQNKLGDCVDCSLCVQVCPTGIDIRNGTQLECINCTACMDACDQVMDKIGRDRGLIRYDSYAGIEQQKHRLFTPRVWAYTGVLTALIAVNILLFAQRNDVEALLLRTPGTLYYDVDGQPDKIKNLYNYQIVNKTRESFPVEFRLLNVKGEIEYVGQSPSATTGDIAKGALFIVLDRDDLQSRKTKLKVEVLDEDGKRVDVLSTNFLSAVQ